MGSHKGVVVLVVALAGCTGAPSGEGWQDASPQLAALGVDSVRVTVRTQAQQEVELGDRARTHIGRVAVVGSEGERSVSVSLNDHAFSQVVRTEQGTMSLTLDGRQTDLVLLDGTPPPAAALQLLDDAKPLVQIAIALGVDVGMLSPGPEAPATPPSPAPMPLAPPAGPMTPPAPPAPPTLCCSSALVTTVGWAWYWEPGPSSMSCRRATDAANLLCKAATQNSCCGLPKECSDCINLGTGYYCYTAGYLLSKC